MFDEKCQAYAAAGPHGNQNAFRHGLAGIAQRRADGVLNPSEQSIREEILSGLLADKGGEFSIGKSSAVRDRKSRQGRIAAGNYCRDDRNHRDQRQGER